MHFDDLKRLLTGEWRGVKHLHLEPPPATAVNSASKLTVIPVAGGSFLQFDYDWTFEGDLQSGVLLLGADEENPASAAWVDSFHMSNKIMSCAGTAAAGEIDLRGSYAAPPGPDWGWRITIRPLSPNDLQIAMHNLSPEGQEDLAVQIDYTRGS